jgi:hypothetical protein
MGTKGYYEAVAQIIPILFLAMAVGEARVRVRDTLSVRTAVLGVLFIGALLAAGEVAALRAVEVGHGSRLAKDLTAFGLGVGIAWIVRSLAVVVYRDRDEEGDAEEPGIELLIDGAFAVTAIGVICALIL